MDSALLRSVVVAVVIVVVVVDVKSDCRCFEFLSMDRIVGRCLRHDRGRCTIDCVFCAMDGVARSPFLPLIRCSNLLVWLVH